METPITQIEAPASTSQVHQLTKVTSTSKYFALAVMITLPFIGGVVGYALAPETVVEVERLVKVEVKSEEVIPAAPMIDVTQDKQYMVGSTPSPYFLEDGKIVYKAGKGSVETPLILEDADPQTFKVVSTAGFINGKLNENGGPMVDEIAIDKGYVYRGYLASPIPE